MNEDSLCTELDARNHSEIRAIFIEVVCVLASSLKKNSLEHLKINRDEEFDMTKNMERLKAPSLEYAGRVMRPLDPKELSIAINELLYHICSRQYKHAIYWVDWVIEFDVVCRHRKEPCLCESRGYPVASRFQCDIVWIIWDAILKSLDNPHDPFLTRSVEAIHELFCVRYTNAACKKRRFMIYYAISMITEPMDLKCPLFKDKELIERILLKQDTIFEAIKQNEITDAIVAKQEKQRNLEKSMRKLKMISQIDFV